MDLATLYSHFPSQAKLVISWSSEEGFFLCRDPGSREIRRHVLARFFREMLQLLQKRGVNHPESALRQIFNEEAPHHFSYLPSVIENDAFMRMYAEASYLEESLFRKIYKRALNWNQQAPNGFFYVGETPDADSYHDIKAVPPGLPPKFSSKMRKKIDPQLIVYVQGDLDRASTIEEDQKRLLATLALLSHGAAYRDLEGKVLYIPSFVEPNKLVPYAFTEHLIWEGVKTISASPLEYEHQERGIYLCQGTEIWPSQPLMLGSIFANLSKEGAATEPYAHSWRQIHKHLILLSAKTGKEPIVTGHSMGGALATQIALYSHPLIDKAYAFNPPVVNERDYRLYNRLPKDVQGKLYVFASIDDLPFWRMGSYVIGNVYVLLGEKRSKFYPLRRIDRWFLLLGLVKAYFNFKHMVPSHQDIVLLMRSFVVVKLTPEEIALENSERQKRSGYVRFISKLYGLTRFLLNLTRKYLRWEKRLDYLKSQLEILELHELDLNETILLVGGDGEIEEQLLQLQKEKEALIRAIEKLHKGLS